jgi:UDP-glucose 4-epimerase
MQMKVKLLIWDRNRKFGFGGDSSIRKSKRSKLPYKIVDREGDVVSAYTNTDKANTILGWKTRSTIEEAIASAWKWERRLEVNIII